MQAFDFIGAGDGNRTRDRLITNHAIYIQLVVFIGILMSYFA